MKIQNVADDAFRRYGKVLEGYDFTELLKEMKHAGTGGCNLCTICGRDGSIAGSEGTSGQRIWWTSN